MRSNILIITLLIGTITFAATASYYVIENRISQLVIQDSEQSAVEWSNYIAQNLDGIEDLAKGSRLTEKQSEFIKTFSSIGHVFRFKLFSPDGHLRLVSDELAKENLDHAVDEGRLTLSNHNPKAADVILNNKQYTEVFDGSQKPNRPDLYAEAYTPVWKDGRMIGVVEVYVDQTVRVALYTENARQLVYALVSILVTALILPITIVLRQGYSIKKSNKELRAANIKAVSADRAKSEFLANMSHEIRTPMNGVMGMAELLTNTNLDTKQRIFADVIIKSGNALLIIINDILDFSKLGAGEMTLTPSPFNLREEVEDIAILLSPHTSEKNIEIAVRIDPKSSRMYFGDAGRLRQIISNIASNAVKFTEKGHVLIDISCNYSSRSVHSNRLTFKISDTGVGIPTDKQAKIFDKFSQVDASTTRKYDGTGLGLAIAKSLVELMGSKLSLDSEVGKGSTFTFEIDLPIHGEKNIQQQVPTDVSGSNILIAEDNETNLAILKEQMISWGFKCITASSGSQALAVLSDVNNSIDAVILDYNMPEIGGTEVAYQIRNTPATKDIPIIILSQIDIQNLRSRLATLAIDAQLTKPIRSATLLETLVKVLQGERKTKDKIAEDIAFVSAAVRSQTDTYCDETAITYLPASAKRYEPNTSFPSLDVLVAEDNEINQMVISQILSDANITFKIAEDGQIAVEMYKAMRPKVILMDVSMPNMDGLDATMAIRKLEEASGTHTPIIGITAHALIRDMEKCIEAGMNDYMAKPVSPNRLQEKVDEWMPKQNKIAASA